MGDTAQLTATGSYSDGSSGNVGSCTWQSADTSTATVGHTGTVTGVAEGDTTVSATCGSLSPQSVSVHVQAANVPLDKPDLQIQSFTGAVLFNGDVEYHVLVTNAGSGYADGFFVDVWLDESSAPTGVGTSDTYSYVSGLGAGESQDVVLDISAPGAGTYQSWAVVDVDQYIDETDETNNTAGPEEVDVQAPLGPPDLVIYNDSETYADGNDVDGTDYVVTIWNEGDTDSGPFWVDLWYDPATDPVAGPGVTGDEFVWVDNIVAGDYYEWDLHVASGPTTDLDWNSCVLADSGDDISEADETNNLDCFYVTYY